MYWERASSHCHHWGKPLPTLSSLFCCSVKCSHYFVRRISWNSMKCPFFPGYSGRSIPLKNTNILRTTCLPLNILISKKRNYWLTSSQVVLNPSWADLMQCDISRSTWSPTTAGGSQGLSCRHYYYLCLIVQYNKTHKSASAYAEFPFRAQFLLSPGPYPLLFISFC